MYIDENLSYASKEATAAALAGDGPFTLSYIVGCLTDPTEDSIATAIEMARAYAPNLLKTDEQIAKDKEIEVISKLLRPAGNL